MRSTIFADGGALEPDVRDVLRRAWRIAWTHRVLWFFGALPLVPVLPYVPLIGYFFLSNYSMSDISLLLNNPGAIVLLVSVVLVTSVISFLFQAFARSATTFGIVQLEQGSGMPTFREISRGGRTFFWRSLMTMLLASLGTIIFLAASSAGLALVGFVPFGLGYVVGQLLFWPATLLVYTLIEQAQTATVADALGPVDAMRRAGELVKENLGIFAVVTLVLYIGLAIVNSLAMLPVTASLLVLVIGRFSGEMLDPAILWIAASCFVLFVAFYLLVQAIILLYARSVHTIIYLRLRRSPKLQSLLRTAEAPSSRSHNEFQLWGSPLACLAAHLET